MYLRRINDADAARFRRDPESVFAATVGASLGGAPFQDWDRIFSTEAINSSFGPSRGLFGRIRAWLIKRAVKSALQKQLDQLNKVKAAIVGLPDQTGPAEIPSPDAMVGLHKSWQIIHYVLTGTPESGPAPLNLLLVGGEEVGGDLGYGPARLIEARALQEFAKALKTFDLEGVLGRLDVAKMAAAGVYCVHEDDEPEGQLIELEEDLRHYLPALQDFADRAVAAREGALIWMS